MIKQIRASYFRNFKNAQYCCLSTDNPPADIIFRTGDTVYLIDTGKTYMYDEIEEQWYEQPSSGGGSGSLAIDVDYSDLVGLTTDGELETGAYYRIRDYVTTVNGKYDLTYIIGQSAYIHYARSAGHQFDLIVQAIDNSHLDEHAIAIQSESDATNYFVNSDLLSWDIKYTIYNNTDKYMWADLSGKGVIYYMKDEFGNEAGYDFKNVQFLAYALEPADGDPNHSNGLCFSNGDNRYGTVYHVFKALQTYLNTGSYSSPFNPNATNLDFACSYDILTCINYVEVNDAYLSQYNADWYYTFDQHSYPDHWDYSLNTGYTDKILCFNNKIMSTQEPLSVFLSLSEIPFGLNGCIFEMLPSGSGGYCFNNVLESNCCYNIFGDSFLYNHLKTNCYGNILGENCYSNVFDPLCYENIFESQCHSNEFKFQCGVNFLESGCNGNIFEVNCSDNVLRNSSWYNRFGRSCSGNNLGTGCTNNIFGANTNNNTLGDNCIDNTFEKDCNYNNLDIYCSNNVFKNDCYGNNIGQFCSENILNIQTQFCTLGSYCENNIFGNLCVHVFLSDGTSGNPVRFYHINDNVQGTNINDVTISGVPGRDYETHVGYDSNGVLQEWNPADFASIINANGVNF